MTSSAASTPIAPLQCGSCGASVPLGDGDTATCSHCGELVPIPEAHQKLRDSGSTARAKRREVERMIRTRLDRRVPWWAPKIYAWTVIPAAVIGVPAALLYTQSAEGWFAREWVVIGGLLPFLVALFPWLVMWSFTTPKAYMATLGIKLRPAPTRSAGEFDCAECGAPLQVEPEALAATCDYCLADSWVNEAFGDFDPGADAEREVKNLADLVSARDFQSSDVTVLLVIYPTVVLTTVAAMWFLLPGREQLADGEYERSVGYEWSRFAGAGRVADAAVVGASMVVVRDGGEVVRLDGRSWEREAQGFSGIAGHGARALLVGPNGRLAWLDDDDLKAIDAFTDVDFHDAWLGADFAVVAGAAGKVALHDGETWRVEDTKLGNDVSAVYGRNANDVYAVGGIGIAHFDGANWSLKYLTGLPVVTGIWGNSKNVFVSTANLGDSDINGEVYRKEATGWQLMGFAMPDLAAIAGDGERFWVVGADGHVSHFDELWYPVRAPCKGKLTTALVSDESLMVGGPEGLFYRPLDRAR